MMESDDHFSPRVLYLWEGKAMYIGEILDNTPHRHHALQIVMSSDKPFRLQAEDTWHTGCFALIAPDYLHQLEGRDSNQILLLIDHEAVAAQDLISRYLAHERVMTMDKLPVGTAAHEFMDIISSCRNSYNCEHGSCLAERITAVFSDDKIQEPKPMNERIQRAMEVIRGMDVDQVSVGDIAEKVYLSESRLIHLFTREVGIPIRRYLLWRRMVHGIQKVLSGCSLTEAAHNAGFADSAHMSRTFRDMFGFTPSEILKNSRFIQVFSCIA